MRNIPENNLAYPLLINLNSGSSGSGFQFNTGSQIKIVTAKHVLFDDNGNLRSNGATIICQTEDINDDSTTIFEVDFEILKRNGEVFNHPSKDVAGFTLSNITTMPDGSFNGTLVTGVKCPQLGKSRTISVVMGAVRLLKDVLVSNDVFLYGYPSSLGLKHSPQFDYNKPLLRKGIVANVYKPQGSIILDCPVYYGNSGGAVVQVSLDNGIYHHHVIGVVSQFVPYSENWKNLSNGIVHTEISNSGYSVAVPMDFVIEMFGLKK